MPITTNKYTWNTPSSNYATVVYTHSNLPRTIMEIGFPVALIGQTLKDGSHITGVILWEDGHYEFTSTTTNVGGG